MMQVGSMAEDNYANMWPDGSRAELQSFFLGEWLLGDYLKARPARQPSAVSVCATRTLPALGQSSPR